MFVKIYAGMWSVMLAAVLGLVLTGNLTMLTITALGFVSFGLVFMGMMCVLPSTVVHGHGHESETNSVSASPGHASGKVRSLVREFMAPVGIEFRKPNLH
jgi:hypothetical protein